MKKQNIMIVDDEEHIVKAMKIVLEAEGYGIITASSGSEALARLRIGPLPALLLIDMFMPRMSGKQLCEEIRKDKQLKNLKVIFVTVAQFAETGKETLHELHVLDLIQKPFDNQDLVGRVEDVLQ